MITLKHVVCFLILLITHLHRKHYCIVEIEQVRMHLRSKSTKQWILIVEISGAGVKNRCQASIYV